MEDQNIKQLIADSIELSEAEERQQKALAEAEEIEFNRLMGEATAARLAETKGIPAALAPYCKGEKTLSTWGHGDDIECLKGGWRPTCFLIDAPDLAPIGFTIAQERSDAPPPRLTGQYLIEKIKVDGHVYYDWHRAIAVAARLHRDNEDRERRGREIGLQIYKTAMSELSPGERLENLIREIAQEAVFADVERMERD